MTDFASTDVTITVLKSRILRGSPGGIRFNTVKIAFGNATLTYPSGGVPMPGFGKFGMNQELEYCITLESGDDATGILWKWDFSNKKLRGFIQGAVISGAASATLDDYPMDGTADPYAHADRQVGNGVLSLGLGNTTAAGVVYFGAFKEFLAAEHAPAAQVIHAVAVGW
jgi:hypothetical protein